jgi:hypothetical protein
MALAQFIQSRESDIIQEWEAFAKTCVPLCDQTDRRRLRNHISGLLKFIIEDMEKPQTEQERSEKSKGQGLEENNSKDSAAKKHANFRFMQGLDTFQIFSEFRALRASILKLWMNDWVNSSMGGVQHAEIISDFLRFNEAIDQMIAESFLRFNQQVNQEH